MQPNFLPLSSKPCSFSNPYSALEWWAKQSPERDGLIFPQASKRLSFSAWLKQSTQLAAGLRALGIVPGDAVAIWAENRAEWVVSQLAIAAVGAVMVPVNTHFREQDVSYVLNHSRATTILLSRSFRSNEYLAMVCRQLPTLSRLRHVICFDAFEATSDNESVISFDDLLRTDPAGFTPTLATPRALASIQYTSGTTGRPKGAALCFEGMMLNAAGTEIGRAHV